MADDDTPVASEEFVQLWIKRRKQLHPTSKFTGDEQVLEILGKEEASWRWLQANATRTDITLQDLEAKWEADLASLTPMPSLSQRAQNVLQQLSKPSPLIEDYREIENDESVWEEVNSLVFRPQRIHMLVKRWAWQRDRLLLSRFFGGQENALYHVSSVPPSWVLAGLGYRPQGPDDSIIDVIDDTTSAAAHYPTIMAYGPVASGMEGVWRFAEQQNIVRGRSTAPHVRTHNGSIVSVGALVGTVLDEHEEEDAFAVGQQLSDATVLAFVLGLKRWTSRGDRNDPRGYVVITVNEYCDERGWARHHKGSHYPKNKDRARQEIMALNKVFVRHKVPDHMVTNDGTRYVEGQLMIVSVGTRDKSGLHPTSFRLSPGTWADDYLRDNPGATALILDRILSIDTSGRTGQLAFRLGLYMALNWRTKYMHKNVDQPHVVHKLLEALGISPREITHREERSRVRSYLIGGLDLLQSPEIGAIGTRDETGALVDDWHYANPSAGDPDAPAAWDDWLDWTMHIPPPYEIGTFYERPTLARSHAIKTADKAAKRKRRASEAAKVSRNSDPKGA